MMFCVLKMWDECSTQDLSQNTFPQRLWDFLLYTFVVKSNKVKVCTKCQMD